MISLYHHYDPYICMTFNTTLREAMLVTMDENARLMQLRIPNEYLSLENLTKNNSFDARDWETDLKVHVEPDKLDKDRINIYYIEDGMYVDMTALNMSCNDFSNAVKDIYDKLVSDTISRNVICNMNDRAWVASLLNSTIDLEKLYEDNSDEEEINYWNNVESTLSCYINRSQEPVILATTPKSPEEQSDFVEL